MVTRNLVCKRRCWALCIVILCGVASPWGEAAKARAKLSWQPRVTFKELVRLMVEADMKLAERESTLRVRGLL